MTSRLNPYLSFAGNTRQAMEFYHSVLGGELKMITFGEFGMADPQVAERIMHGTLETETGFTLMAADAPPDLPLNPGNNITVSISGDDADELHGYWDKLSQAGTVAMPLEKQSWGDEFGMCVDQFDIPWMINIGQASS